MTIRFLADECVYRSTITLLQSNQYDVISIKYLGLSGVRDQEVLAKANESKRILITADLDFANIMIYPVGMHAGIVVLKISKGDESAVHFVLLKMLQETSSDTLVKALTIIDRNKYRIRHEE